MPANLEILPEKAFLRLLRLEQKRTERSRRRFILMLLRSDNLLQGGNDNALITQIARALSTSIRETDITGWYSHGSVLGVIFTEIGDAEGKCIAHALLTKLTNALCVAIRIDQIRDISLSFHTFPEDWSERQAEGPDRCTIFIDSPHGPWSKSGTLLLKRLIDITLSLVALLLLSPLLVVLAIAIKLTSRGPVLFRQVRIGQHGRRFTFLKFRSMYFKNDHAIHESFVKSFISGVSAAQAVSVGQENTFKLTTDPRVTCIGRFLRRTSLDELPQLLNVLNGQMSLVGPRPPVPYEYACYDIWHKRRVMGLKPGITGLWQVEGRSRVTFDDMVRMDLRYTQSWSLWLDIKILLKTPHAVLSGNGAY